MWTIWSKPRNSQPVWWAHYKLQILDFLIRPRECGTVHIWFCISTVSVTPEHKCYGPKVLCGSQVPCLCCLLRDQFCWFNIVSVFPEAKNPFNTNMIQQINSHVPETSWLTLIPYMFHQSAIMKHLNFMWHSSMPLQGLLFLWHNRRISL